MKKNSRKHHYISQFYLKGFAENDHEDPLITVIDKIEKREFKTKAKGIAGIRDFNRVEIEGKEPDCIESELAIFEGNVATAVRAIQESNKFEGENRALILELIAMYAARNPFMRENIASILTHIYKSELYALLRNNNEIKEGLISILVNLYPEKGENISEEDIAKYVEEELTVDTATEYHIITESQMIISIVDLLDKRKWTLFYASSETGLFITSDSPVVLCWENSDAVPAMYRNSPGFALSNTVLYFPLSKNLALIGKFEGEDAIAPASETLVALINTFQVKCSKKQLYMPNTDFLFFTENEGIQKGERLLR